MPSRLIFLVIIVICPTLTWSQYDSLLPSRIPFRKGDKWGYCNAQKKILIPAIYEGAEPFKKNYALVYLEKEEFGLYGVIDTTGKLIFSTHKDTALYITDHGRVYIEKGNNNILQVIEPSGEIYKPGKYRVGWRFSDKLFVAKKGKRCAVIDKNDKIIIPFKYNVISYLDEKGYAGVKDSKGRSGYIDISGKLIIPFFDAKYHVGDFSEDRAPITLSKGFNNPYGFIDRQGKIIIPMIYKTTYQFSEGRCAVNNGIRSGYINERGDTVVPLKYGFTMQFKNGYGNFSMINDCGLVDHSGNEVFRIKGDRAEYINDSLIIVGRRDPVTSWNLTYGIVNMQGKEVLPFIYNSLYDKGNGLIWVSEKGNRFYYMDHRFNKYYED